MMHIPCTLPPTIYCTAQGQNKKNIRREERKERVEMNSPRYTTASTVLYESIFPLFLGFSISNVDNV
jgi:hypothetical protein